MGPISPQLPIFPLMLKKTLFSKGLTLEGSQSDWRRIGLYTPAIGQRSTFSKRICPLRDAEEEELDVSNRTAAGAKEARGLPAGFIGCSLL